MLRSRVGDSWAAPPPSEKYKNIGFHNNTGPDNLNNHKATKPAFNSWPSSAHQRNACIFFINFFSLSSQGNTQMASINLPIQALGKSLQLVIQR